MKKFSITALALVLAVSAAYGQGFQVGTIAGEVRDQTGSVLPGVTVEVKSEGRGFTRTTTTDVNGRYAFPTLPLGRYTVTATLSGFQTRSVTGISVESDRTTATDVTMPLSVEAAEITVTADAPIVDPTNTTVQTRLGKDEIEKLPVGRSYHSLQSFAPGVIGTSNPNVHGSLTSTNIFLFDGVDTTDPTTGTFGANLNFEAIQEVTVLTSALSAEYGRATGATVLVVTKSGTNQPEGSFKYIVTNDDWNEIETTRNMVTGASLARTTFDENRPQYSATLGGPIWRDRLFFFGAYEWYEFPTAAQQTTRVDENYQQVTDTILANYRLTAQLTPSHSIWAKYAEDPITGFAIAYAGGPAERESLTGQNQGGNNRAIQYTGIFGSRFSLEAMVADASSVIDVYPFEVSPLHNGAPHFSLADGTFYNGGAFVGFVDRPRKQATVAGSYYADWFGNSHDIKIGADWQHLESSNFFTYPANQLYIDQSFDPITRAFVPSQRRDYVVAPSTSQGDIFALFLRDKFQVGSRLFLEAGVRFEQEEGESDAEETTFDSSSVAPRFSAAYDLTGSGRSLLIGTAGRIYEPVVQTYSDNFAQTPQRAIYDLYNWNAAANDYVFSRRVSPVGSNFRPNPDLDMSYLDELTVGFQQQIGNTIGIGIRGIYRNWSDLIEDIEDFIPGGTTTFRQVINSDVAEREYQALELTFEKRFSRNWNLLANYTFSEASGNHFSRAFTALQDYESAMCRTTIDPSIGTIPCAEVNSGARLGGNPSFDRPHNVKFLGAYTLPLGPLDLSFGLGGEWISGRKFERVRTVNVLVPGTTTDAGPTYSYYYEGLGSDELDPVWTVDFSTEATISIFGRAELGVKAEAFNVTDNQEQILINNTAFCANTTNPSAACTQARDRFGTATARGSFQTPRTYRLTGLIRF